MGESIVAASNDEDKVHTVLSPDLYKWPMRLVQ